MSMYKPTTERLEAPVDFLILAWLRTIEQDVQQFNMELHSAFHYAQDWLSWMKLVGTASLKWACCCCWWWYFVHIFEQMTFDSVWQVLCMCWLLVGRAPPRPSPGSIQYDGTGVELRQMMPSLHDDEDSGNASDRVLQASRFSQYSCLWRGLLSTCVSSLKCKDDADFCILWKNSKLRPPPSVTLSEVISDGMTAFRSPFSASVQKMCAKICHYYQVVGIKRNSK